MQSDKITIQDIIDMSIPHGFKEGGRRSAIETERFVLSVNRVPFELAAKYYNWDIENGIIGTGLEVNYNKETEKSYDAVVFDKIYLYPTYKLQFKNL
jgi:hypothetical protein